MTLPSRLLASAVVLSTTRVLAQGSGAAPAADDKPGVHVKYDGGLRFVTDDEAFEMKMSFRNQFRFEANRSLDAETPQMHNQFQNHFYVPRTRLQLEGHFFGHGNRFKLEFGYGDQGSFSFIKEVWLEREITTHAYLRVGQWRRPFNRQELVSDFAAAFNERSIQNDHTLPGRDLGVAVHSDYEKSPEGVDWVVGLFNGFAGGTDRPTLTTTCEQNAMTMAIDCTNARPTNVPKDFGPTFAARVGYNTPHMKGFVESDLEGGPLRYSVAAAYKVDLANFTHGDEPTWAENMRHGLEVDALIKAEGFAVHVGASMMKLKAEQPNFGILVQPGYMVVPKTLEVAGRFALITERASDAQEIEARAALNWFWHGNYWRLASDGGFLQHIGDGAEDDRPDLQFRLMMQAQI